MAKKIYHRIECNEPVYNKINNIHNLHYENQKNRNMGMYIYCENKNINILQYGIQETQLSGPVSV